MVMGKKIKEKLMVTKNKILMLYDVTWGEGVTENLESLLLDAHKKFGVKDRVFSYSKSDKILTGTSCKSDNSGLYLHVTAHTPGEESNVIDSIPHEKSKIGTFPPPSGKEFMDGELFAHITENKMILSLSPACTLAVARCYIRSILQNAKVSEDKLSTLEIHQAPNKVNKKTLASEGIKKIILNINDESIDKLNKEKDTKGVFSILSYFRSDEHVSINNAIKNDKDRYSLNILFGKNRNSAKVVEEVCSGLGLFQDDREDECFVGKDFDEFQIITRKNNKFKGRDFHLREEVSLKVSGKSVDFDSFISASKMFLNKIKNEPKDEPKYN